MPLLVAAPPESELSQGDLLKIDGLCVAVAQTSGPAIPGVLQKAHHGLVVSRDCVGANKPKILVAAVYPIASGGYLKLPGGESSQPPAANDEWQAKKRTFEHLVSALRHYRDGSFSPDRFFLGAPPCNSSPRLVAHLDELVTLDLEKVDRDKWRTESRIARLDEDARRALPTRLYWALARAGFDDHAWMPDAELEVVVTAGEAAVSAVETAARTAKLNALNADADNAAQVRGLKAAQAKLETELADVKREVEPYQLEQSRRKAASNGSTSP